MVTNASAYVLCGLTATTIGLVLALAGLRAARWDIEAIRRSGVNGLVLYLAKSACRSWWVRVAVQACLLAFSLVLVTSARVPYPDGAGCWAVAAIEFRRWAIVVVSVLLAAQSALDLYARHRAAKIAERGCGSR